MSSSSPILTPPASPPSPSASYYDLSDGEESDYNTIMHSESGRGVKLLFSKSKVYVHPTASAKDNIAGFIALTQQKPSEDLPSQTNPYSTASPAVALPQYTRSHYNAASYLLSWVPEHSLGEALNSYVKIEASSDDSPPRRATLVPATPTSAHHLDASAAYAFAVPVSEIFSLLIRPPSLGWWYGSVVINTRNGDSFPALFFHDDECQSTILQKRRKVRENFDPFGEDGAAFWGGDEVLRWIKRYVNVERSGADPAVFLVDPSPEDKVGFGGKPLSTMLTRPRSSHEGGGSSEREASNVDAGMDPLVRALKQARWGFLEKMSQVTTFTRKTAESLVENPKVPPQVRRLMRNPEIQTLQDEFDSARVYLARWAMGIAEQSERDRAQRIWTARDVLEMEESDVGDFEILDAGNLHLGDRRKPVTLQEWQSFFDDRTGKLNFTPDEVKERIFHGGLDPSDGVRKEAWLFLTGLFPWESTADERKAIINSKRDEFLRLKGAWWERMAEGHGSSEAAEYWRDQKGRIEKDVHRTDRHIPLFEGEDIPHPDPDSPFAETGTNVHLEQMKDMLLTYNEYNKELGYVQGMSDLLAPIYAVLQDDAIAFWGFARFMDRMERNFLRDQSGMRQQLTTLDQLVQLMDPKLYLHLQRADSTNFFFFFRMLLVWYKREFEWSDTLRLWEALWTDYLSSSFHLFIALAILEKHRDVIMAHLKYFDEVLKYVNELSNTIDLQSTLIRAESLFRRFQRTVDLIDMQDTLPSPRIRHRQAHIADDQSPRPTTSTYHSTTQENSESPSLPRNSNTTPSSPPNSSKPLLPKSPALASTTPNGSSIANAVSTGSDSAMNAQTQPSRRRSNGPQGTNGSASSPSPRVITPELRALLSRKVEILDSAAVRAHGGGVTST